MFVQQLKAKVSEVDLFQSIEDNHVVVNDIKTLLKQLNSPNSPDYIVSFILKFESILEQTTQNIKLKKKSTKRLKQQVDSMSPKLTLITQSQSQSNQMEEYDKKDKDQVVLCNEYIKLDEIGGRVTSKD